MTIERKKERRKERNHRICFQYAILFFCICKQKEKKKEVAIGVDTFANHSKIGSTNSTQSKKAQMKKYVWEPFFLKFCMYLTVLPHER